MKTFLITIAVLLFAGLALGQTVNFSDPALHTAVMQQLKKPAGERLTVAELTRLFELSVSDKGITDLTGLHNCPNLTSLDISSNNIRSLSVLRRLPNLVSLYAGNNQIADLGPIAGLTSLKIIEIPNNQIKDISHLFRLTLLEQVNASGNLIEDITNIATLAAMRRLDLADNAIADIQAVAGMLQLQVLNISGNKIVSLHPLRNLKKLVVLDAGRNQIRKLDPLSTNTSILGLRLADNKISDLYPISGMRQLKELDLADNKVQDAEFIAKLDKLVKCSLARNRIESIERWQSLPALRVLSLAGNQLTSIRFVHKLPNISVLDLSGNQIADITPISACTHIGEGRETKESADLNLADNQIADALPLTISPGLNRDDIVDISNNPIKDKNKLLVSLAARGVKLLLFILETDDRIPPQGAATVSAQEIIGNIRRDVTLEGTFRVIKGEEYAAFDPQVKGLLNNTNTTGEPQPVTIECNYKQKGISRTARYNLTVEDAPRLLKLTINGTDIISEGKDFTFYAFSQWTGNVNKNVSDMVTWEITEGHNFARFDVDVPNKLINTNRTGARQRVTVRCILHPPTGGTPITTAEHTLTVISKPYIKELVMTGPGVIPRDNHGDFRLTAVWVGKDDADITAAAQWTFSGDKDAAEFDTENPGRLISRNQSGQTFSGEASAVYELNGKTYKASRPVKLTDEPYVKELIIEGDTRIAEGASAAYKVNAVWVGREAEYPRQGIVWRLADAQSPCRISQNGTLINTNTSGMDTQVTLIAAYTAGGVEANGQLQIMLEDKPYLKSLEINGPDRIDENQRLPYSVTAVWAGRDPEVNPPGVVWNVLDKPEMAQLINGPQFLMLNRNRTGRSVTVQLEARYTIDTVTVKSLKTVTLVDTPYLKSISLIGPDQIDEDRSARYRVMADWIGRDQEDVTEKAGWSVMEGSAHGTLDYQTRGVLQNSNHTGEPQKVIISTSFIGGGVNKTAQRTITMLDTPFPVGLVITGESEIPENGFLQLKGIVVWTDGRKADRTADIAWKILEGKTQAVYDKTPGLLINRNDTGERQPLLVQGIFKEGDTAVKGERLMVAVDYPHLKAIMLTAAERIPENEFHFCRAQGLWSDGRSEDIRLITTWEIVSGAPHAVFDPEMPGRLNNTNTSGGPQNILIRASCDKGGEKVIAEARILIEGSPFIKTLRIEGPDFVPDGHTDQFKAIAVWQGRPEQDVTQRAVWTIDTDKSLGNLVMGSLSNANTTGVPKQARITVSWQPDAGRVYEAARTVTLMSLPILQALDLTGPQGQIAPEAVIVIKAIANWSDGATKDVTTKTLWEVVKGREHCSIQEGTIKNTNISGQTQTVEIRGLYEELTSFATSTITLTLESAEPEPIPDQPAE